VFDFIVEIFVLGIPLIFKDANSRIESAGQSTEDESALNREPLLFSFDNSNRNNTCLMRVGTDFHRHQDGRPQWSQRFSLEHGSTHRQLQVRSSRNSSDWNYSIGIDVRPGNGQLKKINFIFLSARYMICNQCSYDLLISPRQLIDEASNHLHVSQHATVAYHWPRTDIEQILCARVIDEHQYELVNWSGGFQIDTVDAFHINMRNENGQCLILRVQIIERNSTYFVVFMDSNKMPAPFRLCNRSDIPIQFYQTDTREEFSYLRTSIEPHQSIDYTWDELTSKPTLTCSILDGSKAIYDLLKLGSGDDLFYQNYIYLAFQETFDDENLLQFYSTNDSSDPLSRQLVIEYIDNQLILAQRQENKQSQLWQMTSTGVLIHVGSTSLYDSIKKKEQFDDLRQTFVLDIKDLGDQILSNLMTEFTSLTVRRYDSKRSFTQTWQFLDNGCVCLANTQMCIQVFEELKAGSDVVLGPIM
jgi:vacuolar protein sorting-associated protein 13D